MTRTVCLGLLCCLLLVGARRALAQVVAQPVWTRGAAVEVLWQGQWYPAQVLRANHGWYKIHYAGYESSWDEFVDGTRIRARQAERTAAGPPWRVGDAVSVSWQGTWYQAAVVEVNHGWYRIHYVGYDASGDEIVDDARIRAAAPGGALRGAERPVEMAKPPPTFAAPPAAAGQ